MNVSIHPYLPFEMKPHMPSYPYNGNCPIVSWNRYGNPFIVWPAKQKKVSDSSSRTHIMRILCNNPSYLNFFIRSLRSWRLLWWRCVTESSYFLLYIIDRVNAVISQILWWVFHSYSLLTYCRVLHIFHRYLQSQHSILSCSLEPTGWWKKINAYRP